MTILVNGDLVLESKCETDIVKPIEDASLSKRIDLETRCESAVVNDGLGLEIDVQRIVRIGGRARNQFL